jgi:hypothetical protein
MVLYKDKPNSDLEFSFPDDLKWETFDRQGFKLPQGMKLVDLVIERERDVLLVEIKDYSNARSPEHENIKNRKKLMDNSLIALELIPKVRDSYTYLHLMERDDKPFKYVILIGLDAFDHEFQKGILGDFKNRLLTELRCETTEPWKRKHINDCVVMSVETWNKSAEFSNWSITRLSVAAAQPEA